MAVRVGHVEVALPPRGVARARLRPEALGEDVPVHGVDVVHVEDDPHEPAHGAGAALPGEVHVLARDPERGEVGLLAAVGHREAERGVEAYRPRHVGGGEGDRVDRADHACPRATCASWTSRAAATSSMARPTDLNTIVSPPGTVFVLAKISPASACTVAPERITSPDSWPTASRESATSTLRIAASSSSRQVGRGAPTALTRAPRLSHAPRRTGVCEAVAVTTTSAPRTAVSASVTVAPCSRAKRWACSAVRLHTRTSSKRRTRPSASRWACAWTPLPSRASTRASGAARRRVTAADTAAVRLSVMRRPSITARGSPVSVRHSTMIARWVGNPRRALPG